MATPEERAATLVTVDSKVPGGPYFVWLKGHAGEPVELGPYANPDIAKGDAKRIRQFVAALLREASSR